MKVSIITINYNDAVGLRRTLDSVRSQTFTDYEQIIVDGGSSDGSVDVIRSTAEKLEDYRFKWISEPDRGVYDAQNKGIRMAEGEYCFFLNAGDVFCSENVLKRIFENREQGIEKRDADILYGNEPVVENGKRVGYCKGVENPTFLDLYNSCMKHQATFIRRELFERFGKYDISLRIEADYEWFFRVIAFHNDVTLRYVDVDVANFDNDGVSNHSPEQCIKEDEIIRSRYMSKRMCEDYQLLTQYQNLRYVRYSKILMLFQRMIGKIGRMLYGK